MEGVPGLDRGTETASGVFSSVRQIFHEAREN